jgi:hypothetical protein
MRTTLDIDDPVLAAIKAIAQREGRSAGAVASDLIRRGLTQSASGVAEPPARYGFRPFPVAADEPLVTDEQIDRIRDELGI